MTERKIKNPITAQRQPDTDLRTVKVKNADEHLTLRDTRLQRHTPRV